MLCQRTGHLSTQPHASWQIFECVFQHGRRLIDLNPDLILFLRYEGKVRIYQRARARTSYPANGVPLLSLLASFIDIVSLDPKPFEYTRPHTV